MSTKDAWSKREISFHNLEAARLALQDATLLQPFFQVWEESCDAIDAAQHLSLTTSFARQMPNHGANVLMIGESGAGKSTLVKVMTGDESIVTSSTFAGTSSDARYTSPCKINWVDTPGFKLPISPEEATRENQSTLSRWKDSFLWNRWIARIRGILNHRDLAIRPLVAIYCHRASSRVVEDRMLEIFRLPHEKQIPLIVCITDVCGVDDADLKTVRKCFQSMLERLGPNGAGVEPKLIEINSEAKTVRGHHYKVTGVKNLVETVLNSLGTTLLYQLLFRPWFAASGKKRTASSALAKPMTKVDQDAPSEDEDDDEEEEEEQRPALKKGKRSSPAPSTGPKSKSRRSV